MTPLGKLKAIPQARSWIRSPTYKEGKGRGREGGGKRRREKRERRGALVLRKGKWGGEG